MIRVALDWLVGYVKRTLAGVIVRRAWHVLMAWAAVACVLGDGWWDWFAGAVLTAAALAGLDVEGGREG